jgi:hypothetical protein
MVIDLPGWLYILSAAQFDTQDKRVWVGLGVAVMAAMYLVLRPMLRRKKDPLEKRPFANLHSQRAVEHQMSNLLVELSEMARQLTAQLDTRATKLELLIREADEKITLLKTMSTGAAVTPPTFVPADRPRMEPDGRHTKVYTLADEGRSAGEIATVLDRPKGEIELILALRARS